MLENVVYFLLYVLALPLFFGSLFFIGYVIEEQEHRHKIELEKAKQGIFDEPIPKQSFLKKYGSRLIIILLISIIVILICYAFDVPSDLPKYILDIIK